MLSELSRLLTGEETPFATLVYSWSRVSQPGEVVVNERADRIRKIVVDSGPGELRRWRDHKRDLAADFRRAFGEEPGALTSMAVMTDSDNSRASAHTWYGPVNVGAAAGARALRP